MGDIEAALIRAGGFMVSAVATVAAIALVCAGFAVLLWQRGSRSGDEASAARFIESRVKQGGPGPSVLARGRAAPRKSRGESNGGLTTGPLTGPIEERLRHLAARAGFGEARPFVLAALVIATLACVGAAVNAGPLAATAAGVASVAAACLFVSVRVQRRRLEIVQQLPTFLDGIVRLITLGNSVPAAFQAAVQTSDAPLRECLDHVSRAMRAGIEIDRALAQVGALHGIRELQLVGAVLRLSVKYGGRADVMLERMSVFMRDLEQAERELSAMSAETRLSAWVLTGLPLVIGGFMIASHPSYFNVMWADAAGRRLFYAAFAMQMVGGWLLYRLTRLRF
jgi:tight adherence protein B